MERALGITLSVFAILLAIATVAYLWRDLWADWMWRRRPWRGYPPNHLINQAAVFLDRQGWVADRSADKDMIKRADGYLLLTMIPSKRKDVRTLHQLRPLLDGIGGNRRVCALVHYSDQDERLTCEHVELLRSHMVKVKAAGGIVLTHCVPTASAVLRATDSRILVIGAEREG